jgi:hypothetical protein
VTRIGAWVRGAGAGATAVYFLDPDMGGRRRALLRDQLVHLSRVVRDELESEVRDARNRLGGVIASAWRLAGGANDDVSDETVAQTIRARLARLERPDAIVVEVEDGCVRLRGPALSRDAERARRVVRRVRGARSLVDELEVHAAPDVPALSGEPRPHGFAQMDPSTRLTVGLVGAAAVLPLFRHVPLLRAARLLALAALGSAVYGIERTRRRTTARGPGARSDVGGGSGSTLTAARL